MSQIIVFLGYGFVFYTLFAMFRLIDRDKHRISFSIHIKLVPIIFILYILVPSIPLQLSGHKIEGWEYFFLVLFFVLCAIHFLWKLRFEITSDEIVWHNGIWKTIIPIKSLKQINLYSSKNGIIRIGFVMTDKEKRIRNDIGIEDILKEWTSQWNIIIEKKKWR